MQAAVRFYSVDYGFVTAPAEFKFYRNSAEGFGMMNAFHFLEFIERPV